MKWFRFSQRGFLELLLIFVLSVLFYYVSVRIELAEMFVDWLEDMEKYEFDEIVPTSVFLLVCLSIYSVRRWKESHYSNLERIKAQQKFEQLAFYDSLTGLPNRRLMSETLGKALAKCKRESWKLALLYFDLDGFKKINDSLGHSAGDRYLKEISSRLAANLRESDTLSRLGGDEFVLLLENCRSEKDVVLVADRVIGQVAEPVNLGVREAVTGASIGIAYYPSDGSSAEELLKHADMAMYQAKAEGKNCYSFFPRNSTPRFKIPWKWRMHWKRRWSEISSIYSISPNMNVSHSQWWGSKHLPGGSVRMVNPSGRISLYRLQRVLD